MPLVDIIHKREEIIYKLHQLAPDRQPEFGIMTPQHMVEHLAYTVGFSNGKRPQELYYREEKAAKFKHYTIYTDRELTPGFKAPMFGEELPPLAVASLEEAIKNLVLELDAFDAYFLSYPDAKPMNPTLGELNYEEWVIFHNKHFRHHLKQFGLA